MITILLFFQLITPKLIIHVPEKVSYKVSWFKRIKLEKEFVRYSPKSMEAIDYMKSSYFNYHLYLVNTDLYYDKPQPYWKIKGLSLVAKKCSVVTLKMSDKDIEKVILHEVGHSIAGIQHCIHQDCIMNDAKHKYSNLKNCNDFKNSCLVLAKKSFL